MRNRFDEQLEQLHVEMIQMGALCEDAISAAAEALLKGDHDLAEAAQEAEREIDQKEREVENRCLERSGDPATNVAAGVEYSLTGIHPSGN